MFRAPAECYIAFVEMESSECESANDTDVEQLSTAHCSSAQQSGGGSTPTTAKANRLAVERLQKKRHRAEETTEERAAQQQSYIYAILHKVQPSSLRNCSRIKLVQLYHLLA